MRTTILIDGKLLRKAMKATGLKTKRAVVEAGLQALIQRRGHIGARQDVNDVWSAEDLDGAQHASLAANSDLNSPSGGRCIDG
jgi:Arc/MetJ family transcription regulator